MCSSFVRCSGDTATPRLLKSIFIFCLSWAAVAEGADRCQCNNLWVGWAEAAHFENSWPWAFGHGWTQQVSPNKVQLWHRVLSHREALSNKRSGGNVGFESTLIPNPLLLTDSFFLPPYSLPALKPSCSAHLPRSCSHTTNTNSWVGSFYIKINRSLKTPREAGRQH